MAKRRGRKKGRKQTDDVAALNKLFLKVGGVCVALEALDDNLLDVHLAAGTTDRKNTTLKTLRLWTEWTKGRSKMRMRRRR